MPSKPGLHQPHILDPSARAPTSLMMAYALHLYSVTSSTEGQSSLPWDRSSQDISSTPVSNSCRDEGGGCGYGSGMGLGPSPVHAHLKQLRSRGAGAAGLGVGWRVGWHGHWAAASGAEENPPGSRAPTSPMLGSLVCDWVKRS